MGINNLGDTLFLMLTYECNMVCKYCLVKRSKNWMNFDIAKRAIDIFIKYSINSKLIRIFGGEPMLNFKLLKDIINYAKDNCENIRFDVTTNGTLLNDDMINFFDQNKNIELIVSIDGEKNTHIKNRIIVDNKINSYSWIEKYKDRLIKMQNVTVNKVISPDNVENLLKDFFCIYKLGFTRINFLPAYFNYWRKEKIKELKANLNKLAIIINHLLRKNKKLYIKNLDILSDIPLFNKSLFIDTNGDIYYSNIVITKIFKKNKERLKIGNINNFDIGKIGNLKINLNNILKKYISEKRLTTTYKIDEELTKFVNKICDLH